MAETELSILNRQCLNRRIDEMAEIRVKSDPGRKIAMRENAVSIGPSPSLSLA